jgi:hypothetical protein
MKSARNDLKIHFHGHVTRGECQFLEQRGNRGTFDHGTWGTIYRNLQATRLQKTAQIEFIILGPSKNYGQGSTRMIDSIHTTVKERADVLTCNCTYPIAIKGQIRACSFTLARVGG